MYAYTDSDSESIKHESYVLLLLMIHCTNTQMREKEREVEREEEREREKERERAERQTNRQTKYIFVLKHKYIVKSTFSNSFIISFNTHFKCFHNMK